MGAFHFSVVGPNADPSLIRSFHEHQSACYARYGAINAMTVPVADDEVGYLVVTREHQMVAGIRIHVRRPNRLLPFEHYFVGDDFVRGEVESRSREGLAELAGLWSAPVVARTGIGGFIVGAAVAIAPYFGLRHLCSFAHQFNRFTRLVGFEPDARIGEHAYPDERYRSTVNWCDAVGFPTADPEVRQRILTLRKLSTGAALGRPIALGFQEPTRVVPISSPSRRLMKTASSKTRPFRHAEDDQRRAQRLGPDLVSVETREAPPDVRELLASWPSILAPIAESAPGRSTVSIRTDAGELLATVSSCPASHSPLESSHSPSALRKTRYLGDLAWSDGSVRFAPHALYLGVRRARIDGATTIAGHVKDASGALEKTLGLLPLGGPLLLDGREARAQRVDLAMHRAYEVVREAGEGDLDNTLFGDEVVETFERWLTDLYGRGFFQSVKDGTLSREQYVYTISNMHQFVRWTTRLLGHAVAHSHDRSLRDHFLSHLQGEVNHEIIIERDLAHLGQDVDFVVDRMAASPGTRQFMSVQESLAGMHHDLISFLASPLAAEGVASHLTPAFLTSMEQTIASWGVVDPKRAMTFFSSHVSTDGGDDGHWELVMKVVRDHLHDENDLRRFLGILQASMGALTIAYDEFVDDVALFAGQPFRVRADHTPVAAEE